MNFDRIIAVPSSKRLEAARARAEAKTLSGQLTLAKGLVGLSLPGMLMAGYRKISDEIAESKMEGMNVALLSRDQARQLKFAPGHPLEDHVYIEHPVVRGTYYPLAPFHRIVFEHKFSEALSLFVHLGAKRLRVICQHGWGREFAGKLSITLPATDAVEAGIDGQSGTQSKLLFEGVFNPSAPPTLPDQQAWFEYEPLWRSLADARLRANVETFSLEVTYDDDFGVSGSLKGQVQAAGFNIGGSFQEHLATSWRIDASFV